MSVPLLPDPSGSPRPILSIVTPVFNSGTLLRDGLLRSVSSSVASHTVEWVIVNDASTEVAALERLAELPTADTVTRVDLATNVGPGEARNRGVSQARGEWIAFIDGDDYCDVNKLLRVCLDSSGTDADLLALDYQWQARSSAIRAVSSGSAGDTLRSLISRRPAVWRFVFRSHFLQRIPPFPPLRYGEDLIFLLHAARSNPRVLVLPQAAAVTYRVPREVRPVSPHQRAQLLSSLAELKQSAASTEEVVCIDSWSMRVWLHGIRHHARATLLNSPLPRVGLIDGARALSYTALPHLKRARHRLLPNIR